MNLSIERSPIIKFRLHIIIGALVSIVFILIIARVANNGTPKTRTNIWGIAVVSKVLFGYMPINIVSNSLIHIQSASNLPFSWRIKY